MPANIAESRGRSGQRDRHHFLRIAQGSARELESHLLLARDLGFIPSDRAIVYIDQVNRVQRMLSGLIRSTR
jgi:four helix bundle protein